MRTVHGGPGRRSSESPVRDPPCTMGRDRHRRAAGARERGATGRWYRGPRGQVMEGSAVFLIAGDGGILLQKRDDDVRPAGPGRWSIPGGQREGTESPRETALREFEEETGVRLERLRFFRTVTREDVPELIPERTHLFFADDAVPREEIAVHEGLDFQYWRPEEIGELLMNPGSRKVIEVFLASDMYRGTLLLQQRWKVGVGVIALDRWGRILLQLRDADLPPERYPDQWSLPGGLLEPGEAPDAGALREFEEETGQLLENLKLYRVYRKAAEIRTSLTDIFHIYYDDPDIPERAIEVNEGQAFRYFAPDELGSLEIPEHTRRILDDFLVSGAYRGMFH